MTGNEPPMWQEAEGGCRYKQARSTLQGVLNGIMKYDKPVVNIDQDALDFARWAIEREVRPWVQNHVVRELDEIEVDMTTAAGWRWATHLGVKSKQEAWETAPAEFDYVWEQLGLPDHLREFEHVWSYMLKGELLKAEKIRDHKQRALMYPDVTVLFAGMRMYQDFDERLQSSRDFTRFCIGWSKWHSGVDELARGLRAIDPETYGMYDCIEYDSSLRHQLQEAWFDIKWNTLAPNFKTPENYNRHKWLENDAIRSHIVINTGDVYQKNHGTSSGGWSTASDNTGPHALGQAYSWGLVVSKEKTEANYRRWREYKSHLAGDDELEARTAHINRIFPRHKMLEAMETAGFQFHKTTEKSREQDEIEGLEFLGFTFRKYGDMYVPYYNPVKALCSAYRPDRRCLSLEEEYERVWGLTREVVFTPIYSWMDEFCRWLLKKGASGTYENRSALLSQYLYKA